MDDVQMALQKADGQLAMIGTLCEADLELQRVSPTLRAKINAFLENERLALDHLAVRVMAAGGIGEAHTHYPLAADAPRLEPSFDKNMPGIREARPDVAAVIGRHQPFNDPSLGRLRELLMDVKRQGLKPQTRPAPPDIEDTPPPAIQDPPRPVPPPPPSGGFGGGLTGPLVINGVEHDPVTLRPLNPLPAPRRETIYVAWLFEGTESPALQTLEAIHAAVLSAIDEVAAAAGL